MSIFSTESVNGESGTGLPSYSTVITCSPLSQEENIVSYPSGVGLVFSSEVRPFGVVAEILHGAFFLGEAVVSTTTSRFSPGATAKIEQANYTVCSVSSTKYWEIFISED